MITYTTDHNIFVTFGDRSVNKFYPALSQVVRDQFGEGPFEDKDQVVKILQFGFDWLAKTFRDYILNINDISFALWLFHNHESSFSLYRRTLAGEYLEETEGINGNDLARNRRILKLALEQCTEVDYTHEEKVNYKTKEDYISKIEDILYLGKELYAFAEGLAENRMIKEANRVFFKDGLLDIERNHHYEDAFDIMNQLFQAGFSEGIVSTKIVQELKEVIKDCMGIDYDYAGGQIFALKEHHGPGNRAQTIEPYVLPENIIHQGVDEMVAHDFYDGLTFSRYNKLPITEAVYKPHSMERHFFRPILILNWKGTDRALVGEQKWVESIVVMATNGFQWKKAPKEWITYPCFLDYLDSKSNEHDKLLEDEVERILNHLGIPFVRNIKKFRAVNNEYISIEIKGVGEMDFVFLDLVHSQIVVADCKYLRARYDMVGFSTDNTNFIEIYEPKLQGKIDWLEANRQLIQEHFQHQFPQHKFDISTFPIIGMFIINTPTFYMLNGRYPAISQNYFKEYIEANYEYPVFQVKSQSEGGDIVVKEVKHPYFTIH
jgi:hypothetical protein